MSELKKTALLARKTNEAKVSSVTITDGSEGNHTIDHSSLRGK